MSISVVFLLVEKRDGEIVPYKKSDYDEVDCADKLCKLRDAVKEKYRDSHLKGIAPSDLKVYASKEDVGIDAQKLKFSDPVNGHTTEDSALFVLLPNISNQRGQTLFVYNGRIAGSMNIKGNRRKLYSYAMEVAGIYPQPPTAAFQYDSQNGENKDLLIHVVFESKNNAIQFETFAHQLSSAGSASQFEKPLNFEFKRIWASDYVEDESDSLPYTVDLSISHTSVAENEDAYIYQRIESEENLHIAGLIRSSQRAHIIPKAHCRAFLTTYGKYRTDENNIITLSATMHQAFDSALPLFKLHFIEASDTPVLNSRYKVKIELETYNQVCANTFFPRLKDGTIRTDNPLICFVFIHVIDWKTAKLCLDWRSNNINQIWKENGI